MPTNLKKLQTTLSEIKSKYEDAILKGQTTEVIRGQGLIKLLHTYVIGELVENGIPSRWIHPETTIYGFPKTKSQDILVMPPGGAIRKGKRRIHVGPLMSVNIRSQLSSIEKNFDTLYERLYAEALNIHNSFPRMVLGYVYLIPLVGYDTKPRGGKVSMSEYYNLEKYIASFHRINGRRDPNEPNWKYERVCLLIVDFKEDPPEIIQSSDQLLSKRRVSETFASQYDISELSITTFFDDLMRIFSERFFDLIQ